MSEMPNWEADIFPFQQHRSSGIFAPTARIQNCIVQLPTEDMHANRCCKCHVIASPIMKMRLSSSIFRIHVDSVHPWKFRSLGYPSLLGKPASRSVVSALFTPRAFPIGAALQRAGGFRPENGAKTWSRPCGDI